MLLLVVVGLYEIEIVFWLVGFIRWWFIVNRLWFRLCVVGVVFGVSVCVVYLVGLISMFSVLVLLFIWMMLFLCMCVSGLLCDVFGVMWIVVGNLFDVLDRWLLVISVMCWFWFCSRFSKGVSECSFGMLFVCGFW